MKEVVIRPVDLIAPVVPVVRIEKKIDMDTERDALRGSYSRECEYDTYTKLGRLYERVIRRSVRVV